MLIHTIAYSENVDEKRTVVRPPGLNPTLVLNTGDPFYVENHCGQVTKIETDDFLFSGLQSNYCTTVVEGFQRGTQIELPNQLSESLMGSWIGEGIVSVRQAKGSNLHKAMHSSKDDLDAQDILARALKTTFPVSRGMRLAGQALENNPSLRISELSCELGWTRQHLNRQFAKTYGVSPKEFARVARLQMIFRLLERRPKELQLTQLADLCGFYDQAHLSNEFRAMTGKTLRRWILDCG